jgi:hypothetical protein
MSIILLNDEEATSKINIDELYEKNMRRDLKQLSIFNKILNRIHTRIKTTSRNKMDKYIWYVVPEFIFGEQTYNQSDCIAFIVNKMVDNGFYVKYIHPNLLFVSWEQWIPSYVRNEVKKKTGKQINEKGEIVDKQNNNTDANDLDANNSKLFNMGVNDTKKQSSTNSRFTPIEQYKPSGKLVYNPDFFNKLQEKL